MVRTGYRLLALPLLLVAGIVLFFGFGNANADQVATPVATPGAVATPAPGTLMPCAPPAGVEQPAFQEPGTSWLAAGEQTVNNQTSAWSVVCFEPNTPPIEGGLDGGYQLTVGEGQMQVELSFGSAIIIQSGAIRSVSADDGIQTLEPGDTLMFSSGIRATFTTSNLRTILLVQVTRSSSDGSGCVSRCFLP